jgi:hypothetical protein
VREVNEDHESEATPANRVALGSNCPCCSGLKVSVTNCLATIKPSAAVLWDWDLNDGGPTDVVAVSNTKYWFNLSATGAVLRSSGFKREVGKSVFRAPSVSLASASPELVGEWHPTNNGALKPADFMSQSRTKRWWQCDVHEDHEWEATPKSRIHHHRRLRYHNHLMLHVLPRSLCITRSLDFIQSIALPITALFLTFNGRFLRPSGGIGNAAVF